MAPPRKEDATPEHRNKYSPFTATRVHLLFFLTLISLQFIFDLTFHTQTQTQTNTLFKLERTNKSEPFAFVTG